MSEELWEKVTPKDLEVSLSLGFVCRGTLASFLNLREEISKFFKEKPGQFLVYSTASANDLKLIKTVKEAIKVEQNGRGKAERRR